VSRIKSRWLSDDLRFCPKSADQIQDGHERLQGTTTASFLKVNAKPRCPSSTELDQLVALVIDGDIAASQDVIRVRVATAVGVGDRVALEQNSRAGRERSSAFSG
jgi:hypothetical protein